MIGSYRFAIRRRSSDRARGDGAVVGLSAVSSALDEFPVPAIMVAAVAMGMLNATFVRDGEVSVGLTYMTGTLVKERANDSPTSSSTARGGGGYVH